MSKQKYIFPFKFKYYYTLLISSLLFIITFSNHYYVNSQEIKGKTNLLKDYISKISKRVLETVDLVESEEDNTTRICEKTSDKLKKYYETGDKTILGIDDDNIKGEQNEYIDALISLSKIYFTKKGKETSEKRNLLAIDKDALTYLITYGKHILPLLVIAGIAILSFPGWIVCLGLWCGDCCCCCCCTKDICKIPSFVFSYIFYGICALVCFYGLSKSNSIFVEIADTKCSILKFIDEVVDGESNNNPPYWAGIENITDILDRLAEKVDEMKTGTENILNNEKSDLDIKRGLFEGNLDSKSDLIAGGDYKITYDSKQYQLDLANEFGIYDNNNKVVSSKYSISGLWIKEYNSTATIAEECFVNTTKGFQVILNGDSVSNSLEQSKLSIKEIKDGFDKIKLIIAGNIIKYGDDFDKYGKLTFKLVFSVLILMNAGIATFMILLCCCSGKLCTCCCCGRGFCKLFIHIIWALMGIFMIFFFLVGALFTISGRVGEDMISVVAYLVSEENLGEDSDTILFGEVKKYLNKCYNGDGDISKELGFNEDMKYFQILKNAELKFGEIKPQFVDKKQKFVYKEYLSELNKKCEFNSDELSLIATDVTTTPSKYLFTELLNSINTEANTQNKKETWDITSTSTDICSSSSTDETHSSTKNYHPKKCFPTDKTWVINTGSLSDEVAKLNDFRNFINLVQDSTDNRSIKKIINDLSVNYDTFLDKEISAIDTFMSSLKKITNIVVNVSGKEEEIFSFINCKFIKSNTQILLAYFKNAFGNDIYMIGIYLLLAAFSLAFGISFTLLLTVILKKNVEKNIREEKEKENKHLNVTVGGNEVPEYPIESEQKVLPYYKN